MGKIGWGEIGEDYWESLHLMNHDRYGITKHTLFDYMLIVLLESIKGIYSKQTGPLFVEEGSKRTERVTLPSSHLISGELDSVGYCYMQFIVTFVEITSEVILYTLL